MDEVGTGMIGTMPIGGSGSGALPGTFNTVSFEAPQKGQVTKSGPTMEQVVR